MEVEKNSPGIRISSSAATGGVMKKQVIKTKKSFSCGHNAP